MNSLRMIDSEDNEPFEDLDPRDRAAAGQARARREGSEFDELALKYLQKAEVSINDKLIRIDGEITIDARVAGPNGKCYWVLGHGNLDASGSQRGLQRTDTVLKTIGAAYILSRKLDRLPILLVTSHLPKPASAAGRQLSAAADLFFDVIATTGDLDGFQRLLRHTHDANPTRPTNPPWMTSGGRRSANSKRVPCGQTSLVIEEGENA